ncbi:MAG: S-layer homology domain-containing protein [Clostridiales bacterium]|nr:S-layer homology domain-containing protein [Clostridiales bacterium]
MKRKGFKRLIAALLAIIVLSAPITSSGAETFTDLAGYEYASEAIADWAAKGIIVGFGDGTYRPASYFTLAQYASVISRVLGYTTSANAAAYPQLSAAAWYTPAILKCIQEGVITVNSGGIISPDEPITRGEIMVFTAKAYKIAPVSGNTTFIDDATIPEAQKPYIKALQDRGLVVGSFSGTGYSVSANAYINRGDTAVLLYGINTAWEKIKAETGKTAPDASLWPDPLPPSGSTSYFKPPSYATSSVAVSPASTVAVNP